MKTDLKTKFISNFTAKTFGSGNTILENETDREQLKIITFNSKSKHGLHCGR